VTPPPTLTLVQGCTKSLVGRESVYEFHRGLKVAVSGEWSELEIRPSSRLVGRTAAISIARIRERRASHGCGGYQIRATSRPLTTRWLMASNKPHSAPAQSESTGIHEP